MSMSVLDRYRKAGGFKTLLQVVETTGPSKQEKFLELIRAEDSGWADAVKSKSISMNRIYTWDDSAIYEIIGALQDLTLATALRVAPDEFKLRVDKLLTNLRRRKIFEIIDGGSPNTVEISATQMKIIGIIRQMINDGTLRLDIIDPPLQIEDDIEERLNRPTLTMVPQTAANHDFTIQYESPPETDEEGPKAEPAPVSSHGAHEPKDVHSQDILNLKKKLLELNKENSTLRQELIVAKAKLAQIKKIA
jgi:hypothetical protein